MGLVGRGIQWTTYFRVKTAHSSHWSTDTMKTENIKSEKWMTVEDVAEYLQVSKESIYKLAQRRKIPAAKILSQWRFKKVDIDKWVDKRKIKVR